MKTAGMIGGLGPESTIDYYKLLNARWRARRGGTGYPALIINGLDVDRGIAFLDEGRLDALADYLAGGVAQLARAGADFGFFAANTPHIVFDEVARRSPIPLLSIVGATLARVRSLGLARVGLFGTGFTMRARFFPEEMLRPTAPEQALIHDKYIHELLVGRFLPETRAELLGIARRMQVDDGIQALVLAGTELPLLLRGAESDLPLLDTAEIHVDAIVDALLSP